MVQVMGIKFAPLNVPLRRRLQVLAALSHVGVVISLYLSCVLGILLVYFSRCYWLPIVYIAYLIGEREAMTTGSRRSPWVRSWAWWRFFRDYFPVQLVKTAELDPTKNHLLCCYPHGLLASGPFANFATEATSVDRLFPGVRPYVATVVYSFFVPGIRELLLSMGFCSSSRRTLDNLLDPARGTGRAVALVVGGVRESKMIEPRRERIYLKKRKGFIKVALSNGATLVPVYTFGENDLYDRVTSGLLLWLIRCLPKPLRDWTGLGIGIINGRGLFQYSFGVIARRHPLTTVVGKPIEVERVAEPTQEQIDELHTKYTEELVALFEEHKHRYLDNPENASLIIE